MTVSTAKRSGAACAAPPDTGEGGTPNAYRWTKAGIALLLGLAASVSAWAEGSRTLYPSSYNAAGFRATMDQRSNGTYMGVIPARQFLYVYAEANEYILLGSRNRNNGTSGDISVYNPQDFGTKGAETQALTVNFSCVQTTPPAGSYSGTTLGQIGTRANELAGPNSADNSVTVTNGYAPCAYRAPVTGIYGVRFAGGASGNTVDGSVGTPQLLSQQVSAWDITVRANATSTADLSGRVFTYAWVGYTGGNPRAIYHTLYYSTLDGYRYRQTMQGLDPNAYTLYANSQGFVDEGSPLYKDIRGNSQFVDTGFPAGVTAQRPQFPIFFSDISPTGANATQVNKVFTYLGIPATPPVPELSAVSFTGNVSGSTSTVGAGGTFQFTTVNTVSYQIVVSAGVDFDPGNVNNRVLTGTAGTGTHTVIWDGKSNAGTNFPAGGPYQYRVTGRNGEIHFPIIDTEGNATGGPTLTKLNGSGDSTVYYDDRSYVTRRNVTVGTPINGNLCGGGSAQVPPSPPYNLLGVDSSVVTAGRYYRWWTASGNNNSDCVNDSAAAFGDAKGLDLWAFASTGDINETLVIVPQTVTRDLGTEVAVDPTASPGQTVYGSFVFRNDGTGTATVSSVTATIGTAGNCPASVTFTFVPPGLTAVYSAVTCQVTFTGITSMTAGQQHLFRFTYPAPASGTVPVVTTIAGNETAGATSPNTDTGITTIIVADVSAAVSVPPTAPVGSTVPGTITFANGAPGNTTANAVVYTARIGTPGSCPANVTFPTPPAGVTLSYNATTCDVLFTGMPTQLTIGQSVPINFTYTAPASGTVPVTATIATSTAQVTTANDTANGSTTFFVPSANVGVVKNGPAVVAAGDTIIYTLLITNAGADGANGTTYSDTVPAAITAVAAICGSATGGAVCAAPTVAGNVVSGTVPTLPSGGSVTITITGTAPATGQSISNTATVAVPPGTTDPTPGNNTSTTTTPVVAIVANDNTYGPINGNTGNANVGNVLGNDTLNGSGATVGTVTVSVVTPASNAGVSLNPATGIVSVAPGTPGGTYTIVYRICSQAQPAICDDATVTVNVTAPSADLSIVKSGPAAIAANGSISYTLVITNAGTGAADNATYADTVPAAITGVAATCGSATGGAVCAAPVVAGNSVSGTVPTLPSGSSVTITITGTAPATAQSINNTATVSVPPGVTDPTPGNNTSTTTTQVVAIVADDNSYGPINGNTGNSSVGNVLGNDTLNGAGATIGNVTISIVTPASNAGVSLSTATGNVNVAPGTPAGTYTIVYRICSQAQPAICDDAIVTVVVERPSANLGIVKSGPAAVATNGTITYTLVITNAGPDAANNATYSDAVPGTITGVAASCGSATGGAVCDTPVVSGNAVSGTIPTLPSGGSVTITITGTAPATNQTIINSATVSVPPGVTDPTPGNNTSSTPTPVVAIVANDNTYGPINGNSGNANVGNVLGNDTLNGSGATVGNVTVSVVTPASNAGVSLNPATGVVSVAPGTPAGTYTIVYRICSQAQPTICDDATVTVNVEAPSANLGIVKSGPAVIAANGAISYTLVITNAGTDAANNATYADTVPASVTGVAATCGSATGGAVCAAPVVAGNAVSGSVPTLPSGGSVTITITGTAPATGQSINNTATVSVPPGVTDPTPGNNTSTTTTQVVAIVADDNTYGPINGNSGNANVGNVLDNDTLNGAGATVGNVTVSIVTPASNAGVSLNPATGVVSVAPGTPAGPYTIVYRICSQAQPAICDDATVTVNVTAPSADLSIVKSGPAAIAANGSISYTLVITNAGTGAADNATYADTVPAAITGVAATCGSATGGAVCAAPVVAGNALSGTVPTLPSGSSVTITITGTAPATAQSINNTATVSVPPGVTDPTPGNNTSTTTTQVVAIVADDNSYGPINGNTGNANVGNVLGNDTLNGAGATVGNVTVSIVTPASNAGVSLNPATGIVSVAPGTPGGTYTIVYRICSQAQPAICDDATVTVNVTAPSADLSIVKSGPATIAANGAISYSLVITNAGADAANNATYADTVPASVTGVAASCGSATGGAVCSAPVVAGNTVSGTIATLPSGGSVTITVTGTAPSSATTINNTATVSVPPGVTDPTPGNNTSTTTTQVDAVSNLSITKTNGTTTYTPGTTSTYVLTVANAGPSTAANVTVSDTLPAGVTLSGTPTCVAAGASSCGTITGVVGTANFSVSGATVGAVAGDTLTYSLPVRYDSSMTAANVLNTASTQAPSDPGGTKTATDTDTRSPLTALNVVKSDNSATYTPGSTASYVVTVTNAGPSDAHNVGVTDALPAGVTLTGTPTCTANGLAACGSVSNTSTSFTASGGSIAAGAGNALVFTLPVAFASNLSTDPLVNTANATDPADPDGASGSDSNTRVATSGLSIAKTDGSATYTPGGTAIYTITVGNSGPTDANAVTVGDTLPAGVTVTGTVTCAVNGTAACGTISVTGGNTLAVTGASIAAGAGNSLVYSVPVTFAASLTTSPLVNTASVSDPQDPSGPHTATDTNTIDATTALAVAKTDGALSYTPGTAGTYTVTVTNAGPSDAHDVDVTDTLPAGVTLSAPASCAATGTATCGTVSNTATSFTATNGTIAAGAGHALVFTLPVTFAANLATNPLVNTATATDPEDPDGASGTDTNSLNALTGLNVTKTDGSATYTPGGTATYTVVVTNAGPSNSTGIVLNDPLPAGVTLSAAATCVVSGTASCGTVTGAAGATSVGITGGSIAAGAGNSLTLSLPVAFAPDLTANPLANTVSVNDAADPTPRTATDSNTVAFATGLTIAKDDSQTTYTPGGTATYVITVGNTGLSDATGVAVTDTLPAGVTIAAAPSCVASGAAVCGTVNGTVGGSNVGLSAASIPAGAANQLRLTVPVQFASGLTTNPLVNTATASDSSGAPPVSGSDSNTRVGAGSLAVTKTDGAATYVPGGTATYTIVVTNTGVTDAAAVSVNDPLPTGVTLDATPTCVAAGTATCGTITGAAGGSTFSVANASVPAGAGNSLTYSVPVRFAANLAANPLVNTVTVSDPSSPSATANDSNTPSAQVGLVLTKTDNSATYTPGGNATYVITVGNTGPSNASGIALTDPLPAGVTLTATPTCSATGTAACGSITGAAGGSSFAVANASIAAGAGNGLTYSLPVAIAASVTASPLVNTVTATAPGSNGANASDNSTLLASTGLTVTKDDSETTYVPGDNAVYVIEIANGGPSNANAITVSDPLPAGVTLTNAPSCVVVGTGACGTITGATGGTVFSVSGASLAAGAANRLRYSVPVSFAPNLTADPLVNTVTVSDPSDPTPHTATDSNVRNPLADIGVVKTGPATMERGQRVTYTIAVTNDGPSDAANVQLVDPTPPGLVWVSATAPCAGGFPCDLGTVANGQTITFTVQYDVEDTFTGTSITNTVTVTTSTTDPNGSNSSSTASSPLGVVADVVVTKAGPATAVSNQAIAYVVTVRNAGPSPAQGVVLNDPTPAGLNFVSAGAPCASGFPCVLGDLAVGQSVDVTVNYTVRSTAVPVTIENIATATSTTPDSNTGNNSGTQVTQVTGIPLEPPTPVPAGSWLTLLLTALGLGALAWQRRRAVV
jgi:uncharacterized repeat protein (TIGR01451 family)